MKIFTEIKWAIFFSLFGLAWMVMEKQLGWHEDIQVHEKMSYLFMIPAILFFVFALKDKKNNDFGGHMTWQQGFISGAIISIIIAVLSPLSQYITHKMITPEFFPNMIEQSVAMGMHSQESAEKYFSLKNYIIQSTIFGFVMGLITSAIVALFVKSKK